MSQFARETGVTIHKAFEQQLLYPQLNIEEDLRAVYQLNEIKIGWPRGAMRIFEHLARPNTKAIIGVALGDEGKGRIVDNEIGALLSMPGVEAVVVIRFGGANNSGHTVQKGETKLALHQVPCGVMYEQTVCIMDRGMAVNPVDLIGEIHYVENAVGDTRGKLYLSPDAILNTDLDRAEELLNRVKQGKSKGGTGRGVGPSYAHHYDRLGYHISDLMADDWREKLGRQYDRYEKEVGLYELPLGDMDVPDFAETKRTGKEVKRKVGTREEFLDRIEAARTEIIARDMVRNIFIMHQDIYQDLSKGVLFEGAQAVGLHPWFGTLPDTTSSDTTAYGIQSGTAFWKIDQMDYRIGIIKVPYTSSVGARHMPTQADNEWSTVVRDAAHEFGTTTGRPRDICYLDLAMLAYNIQMSGAEMLALTHLDISWDETPVKICTHYTRDGEYVSYQPGLEYQKGVTPHYVEVAGWNGADVQKARSVDELPENAKKFLAFLQRRLIPIVAVTTGPERENYLDIPDYSKPGVLYRVLSSLKNLRNT